MENKVKAQPIEAPVVLKEAGVRQNQFKELSSYKIFQRFVRYSREDDGSMSCDATPILSRDCYNAWLQSRRKTPKKPMEAFRRALTAHCRGVDGRRPFPEEVEMSLLTELRKKKRWACFEECDESVGLIGVQGFPSRGFHERQRLRRDKSPTNLANTGSLKRGREELEPLNDNYKRRMTMGENMSPLLMMNYPNLAALSNNFTPNMPVMPMQMPMNVNMMFPYEMQNNSFLLHSQWLQMLNSHKQQPGYATNN